LETQSAATADTSSPQRTKFHLRHAHFRSARRFGQDRQAQGRSVGTGPQGDGKWRRTATTAPAAANNTNDEFARRKNAVKKTALQKPI